MRKLELKDIAGYLPYNLQIVDRDNEVWTVGQLGNISCYNDGDISLFRDNEGYVSNQYDYVDDIKPILHPMTDLIKPMTVKGYNEGKEFVPLFELAKLAYDEVFGVEPELNEYNSDFSTSLKDSGAYEFDNFSFNNGMFEILEYGEIIKSNKRDEYTFVEIVHTPLNQCKYFDLLNQWHFDYNSLIECNLAIDINKI